MKQLIIIPLVLLGLQVIGQSDSKPLAIVELFTSQGCSSCPSADELLRNVVDNRSEKGEVIGLSFHVSYWNRLGWKDPYSDEQYTGRQQWYAEQKRLRSMYTPQMIVDGQDEFVGSNKTQLKSSLLTAFNQKKSSIQIQNMKKGNRVISFDFECEAGKYDVINFAVVQRKATNYVPRGENQRRTLKHANVVRSFQTIPFQKNNQMNITLPEVNDKEELFLVAYAQDQETQVIGAIGVSSL